MNHSYFLESDMSLMEAPERNLAFDLVRVTEAAALASARWLGRGDKNAGDGAAVDAMRLSFNSLPIAGKVVIGEGEKDEAPMLFNGEKVGNHRLDPMYTHKAFTGMALILNSSPSAAKARLLWA